MSDAYDDDSANDAALNAAWDAAWPALVDSAEHFTCTEADGMRDVLLAVGMGNRAEMFMRLHAQGGCTRKHSSTGTEDLTLREWWVTFGIQYPSTPHPRCAWVHTDGYLVVIAPTEADARLAAIDLCGTAWSGLYPAGATDWREAQQYWPMGELARLDSDGVLTVGAR